MLRWLPLGLLLIVVTASGAAHGLWSGRWNVGNALEQAADRLAHVPMTVGDWDGSVSELDERQMQVAELSGARVCEYVNRRTGSVVSTLLVCGRPGPVSVHAPEICYIGNGYELAKPRDRFADPSLGGAELRVYDFHKPQASTPDRLRIFCSWSVEGAWSAPENPRLKFFREPYLYKLYVTRKMLQADEPLEDDSAIEFLKLFLPQLQKTMFKSP